MKNHPRSKSFFYSSAAVLSLMLWSGMAQSQDPASTPSSTTIPPVSLAHTPLHSATTMDKPTMALALSVEFPTVGSQYRDTTYNSANEYIGYYDAESCYEYLDAPTDTVAAGKNLSDYKRFKISSAANSRKCTGENFSGNFLNWASSSAIDMLRLALSGGDRYIDESGLTVLQRAVLPNGSPSCFWNEGSYFPARKVEKGDSNYQGALPESMRTAANSSNIWVANILNRIYFRAGQNSDGSCTNSTGYTLGTFAQAKSSTTRTETTLPTTGMTQCATDGNLCNFTGIKEVWFGKSGGWIVRQASSGVTCNTSNLGTPSGDNKNRVCHIRDYTGSWVPSTTATYRNTDGFFYARAEVCGSNAGGGLIESRDYDFCKQYPNGKFKPIGAIQKYSDNLRIAAFGYVMDQSTRYGGVLRAPMKYVGPKTFDIYGREEVSINPNREWDIQTGIFFQNPNPGAVNESGVAFENSGVINYLNKFGRTGSTPGVYKQYDTLSELYYQSLRYLQGLPPTQSAISGLTDSHYDGYPVYKNWDNIDPYGGGRSNAQNYACLKSNIVLVGDQFTHEGNWREIPNSGAGDAAKNIPNFKSWLAKIGAYESANFSNSSFNTTSQNRNQIAGYAYWAHANDIRGSMWTENEAKQRPGLRVKTFFFDVNENSASNDLATRSTSNPFFMGAKYGGYETDARNPDNNPYSVNEKPDRTANNTKDDRIWKRADQDGVYRDASTYYLQSNARGVLTAFDDIFNRASSAAQSISQSAASTSAVNASTDSHIYTGTYDTASWTGNVVAKKIVMNTSTKNITLEEDSSWNPAAKLNARTSSRNIVMGLGSSTRAVDFLWSELQGTAVEEPLSKSSPSAVVDSLGASRVDFLRGGRTQEGTLFRTRLSLLGDIINAGVTYSGKPTNKFTDKSYQLFLSANSDRLPIVVTGANDGMLHAFAAKTQNGVQAAEEVFAYIPSWMAPKLSSLADPNYVREENHQAFVDAPSAVGEAQISFTAGNGSADDWKTVLVSGTGAGGRGVFALDITDPTNFGPSKVMWEFTHNDDVDLGFVVSKPKILKFKTGVNTYRWFAAVASGVNNYNSTFNSNGGSGAPAIFLLALDKSATDAWVLNTNYFKISFPLDAETARRMPPGIIDFSMLWAAGGEVTHIYAGDLHGNIWKLDFTDELTTSKYKPTSDWNVNKLSFFKKGTNALPFYIAKNGSASAGRQPISAAPLLVTGPIVGGVESFYVLLGTGKYLELSDSSNTSQQSFYVLYDDNSATADSSASTRTSAISSRARLQQATIDTTAKTITVPAFTWGRATTDTDSLRKSGWYFDFPESAERMIYSAENIGQFNVSFNSVIPSDAQVNNQICTDENASSNIYDVNIKTGGGRYKVSQIGILGPSIYLVNEEKTTVDKVDSTGRARRTVIQERISVGSSGHAVDQTASIVEIIGRLSWRQIYNYKALRNSNASSSAGSGSGGGTSTGAESGSD